MKKTQRILNQLICDLKNGDFKYQPKEEKEIDWGSYNAAKINEMHFFFTFVKEAVDMVKLEEQKTRQPGRPAMNAYDLVKIILIQMYFQTAERQASGLALLFKEKLMLIDVPSPRTIGRAYSRDDVQYILNKVLEMTNAPILNKESSFSADGTGLPLTTKQNYENDRENMSKHAAYDKLAVMVSNNFHIATAYVHAKGTANDSPLFRPLMIETSQRFQDMSDVELDAGFISRDNCDLISDAGAMPYIYPYSRQFQPCPR